MDEILKFKKFKRNYHLPLLVGIFFSLSFILTVWFISNYSNKYISTLITQDIHKLDNLFRKINEDAHILDFRQDKNYIDFLNIEKFAGSMVGSMNLEHPQNWKGPYLKVNPTVKEKFYEIIKTKHGFFIVPPEGIQLSNDKVIGKDIIFSYDIDVESMLKDPNSLLFDNKPLAAKINIHTTPNASTHVPMQELEEKREPFLEESPEVF